MRRINRIAWLVLAGLSFLVGTWVLLAEGAVHSKFYVFYGFTVLIAIWVVFKRKLFFKNTLPKKRL